MKARSTMASWNGVRMRTLRIGADPDAIPRSVTLPASWSDSAAAALAALAPGQGAIGLAQAASAWLDRIAAAEAEEEGGNDLPRRLAGLLGSRAATAGESVWRGQTGDAAAGKAAADEAATFVVNLAAFARPGAGFEVDAYVDALQAAVAALRRLGGASAQILLGNLDACLAIIGLDYDSQPARDVAACLIALASATIHPDTAPRHGRTATPPQQCLVPRLASRAAEAWRSAVARTQCQELELFPRPVAIESGFSSPGPVDALLGFEACGIAPVFSPLAADGSLAESTLARLAARGISPAAAFAASLDGRPVLRGTDHGAEQAMHRAVRPFIDRVPPPALVHMRKAAGGSAFPVRRHLPPRHGGFTQKASIGGHRLYLRTGEYADGTIGELAISPVRESPAQRGLMDAFSQAVSIGLQHGVPLEAYVDAFAYSQFGPHGAVEGDAAVGQASSVLDYAFRSLAAAYLGCALEDAPRDAPQDAEAQDDAASGDEVLLPLDLPPASARRRRLRLVG